MSSSPCDSANLSSKKLIFSFWEPRNKLPGYLNLCIQTWKKFLPEYEIVILDYSNLDDWLGKNCFDSVLYEKFSITKQSDAIRCALLQKYGGIWMDCDTIITSENIRIILDYKASFTLIGNHIAFISAEKESPILTYWLKCIKQRLRFYKEYTAHPGLGFLLFFKYGFKYPKLAKNIENWDFLGNGILNKIIKKYKKRQACNIICQIDRKDTKILPELTIYKNTSQENYQSFYFDNDYTNLALDGNAGLILLHNSWTPAEYKSMPQETFLRQNNTIANILKKLLK